MEVATASLSTFKPLGKLHSHPPPWNQRACYRLQWTRTTLVCRLRQNSDDGLSGEEPPESLFMRELKRRGMSPSQLEDKSSSSTSIGNKEDELGADSASSSNRTKFSRTSVDSPSENNQRERSMALNSEGLDGLLPRATALVSLGGTFFLAFWPFIVGSIAVFIISYIYFGTSFYHTGEQPPLYVDPYQLLEEKGLSSNLERLEITP